MAIESCAVLGAGVMGSAIAAHLANAGFPVLLLDLPGKNGGDRNAIAKGAIERMQRADPQPFMTPDAARLITPGNFEDDMGRLAGCDWMIEAIVEDLRLKRALYDRIDAARKPGSIVSSNTSTIPLHALEAKQSRAFKQDFCITHFFNPPRYMRLLELVRGAETRPETITELAQVCDQRLGKGVVICHDTPGFIANRIGNYWITCAMSEAFEHGLTVEEADAAHRPMGIPKTGVFGLLDLVGIDLAPLVAKSMLATLPESDDFRRIFREHSLIARMIARGYTGRKGKGGFYRVVRDPGDRRREAIDLQTGEYRPVQKPKLEELEAGSRDLGALATHPGKVGRYVRAVLLQTLSYAASLVPEIADTVFDVDRAMRLGYAWKYGPFELIDRLGADNFAQALEAAGMAVPPLVRKGAGQRFYRVQEGRLQYLTVDGAYAPVVRPEGVLLLEDIKRASVPVMKNGSAALWDIRDGVVCFEFTTKMNALDPEVMALLGRAIAAIPGKYKGMVIYNEGENFSVGANLGVALFAANVAAWPVIEQSVESGQQTYKALKYAPFPVVGAPSGMALGGGCEILLHCSVIQAHAEAYVGLVEAGVGLVPGWGGCKELLARWAANPGYPKGPMPPVAKAFEIISTAQVSKSAAQAAGLGFLRDSDGITMNRDRLLYDAKQRVLALADGYQPPKPLDYHLPGESGRAALGMMVEAFRAMGKVTPHDLAVSASLGRVLTGGDADYLDALNEGDLTRLEREEFVQLIQNPATLARMEHMLATGRPLRN